MLVSLVTDIKMSQNLSKLDFFKEAAVFRHKSSGNLSLQKQASSYEKLYHEYKWLRLAVYSIIFGNVQRTMHCGIVIL